MGSSLLEEGSLSSTVGVHEHTGGWEASTGQGVVDGKQQKAKAGSKDQDSNLNSKIQRLVNVLHKHCIEGGPP